MASGSQMKMVAVGMIMLAILFIAAADASGNPTCIQDTGEVGAGCICSKNCACAGKCILEGGDGDDVKSCFVECVLKNDCGCHGSGLLPAILDKTLRLNVTRPKVPRSAREKELLVVAVVVEPRGTGTVRFDVYVNAPEGLEEAIGSKRPHFVGDFVATPEEKGPHSVDHKVDISGSLRAMRADGDETIVVSLVPKAWGDRVTVRSVIIE